MRLVPAALASYGQAADPPVGVMSGSCTSKASMPSTRTITVHERDAAPTYTALSSPFLSLSPQTGLRDFLRQKTQVSNWVTVDEAGLRAPRLVPDRTSTMSSLTGSMFTAAFDILSKWAWYAVVGDVS